MTRVWLLGTCRALLRVMMCVSLLLFSVLAVWISVDGSLPGDRAVLLEMHQVLGTSVNDPMAMLGDVTDTWALAALTAFVLVVLVAVHRPADAAFLVVAAGGVFAMNPLLKMAFARTRPDLWSRVESSSRYSFPSGHAANSAALAGALLVLAWATRWRTVVAVAGGVLVVMIGFSRLALGVHYPSDIIAGWSLALGWLCALTMHTITPRPPRSAGSWRLKRMRSRLETGPHY